MSISKDSTTVDQTADHDKLPKRHVHEDQVVELGEFARLPTVYGEFEVAVFQDGDGREHLVLRMGECDQLPVLARVHSECLTGEVFGSLRCDCREQWIVAMKRVSDEKGGLLVYLRQEGRGIGMGNKIRAYSLQDRGLDTVDANLQLGLQPDHRNYFIAAAVMRQLGVNQVRLLTNNPQKIDDLQARGIEVAERIPHQVAPQPENEGYLLTKAERLGHMLTG